MKDPVKTHFLSGVRRCTYEVNGNQCEHPATLGPLCDRHAYEMYVHNSNLETLGQGYVYRFSEWVRLQRCKQQQKEKINNEYPN